MAIRVNCADRLFNISYIRSISNYIVHVKINLNEHRRHNYAAELPVDFFYYNTLFIV